MTQSWFMDGIRMFFATIDNAIYSLITIVYGILMKIARVEIFNDGIIDDFYGRIYGLLGLIMLFKVTFSFITYLVNPDDINDKTKGAHKIILNILIVLAMIIITPTAFGKLYEAQGAILNDNIIPKFILGTEGENYMQGKSYQMSLECDNVVMAKSGGDFISIMVFRPFFQLNLPADEIDQNILDAYCKMGSTPGNFTTITSYLTPLLYNYSQGSSNIGGALTGAIMSSYGGTYIIDYKIFLSTLVGIVVLLVLVSFCFDVAVRTIKLGFLQIIAPIPIISYVDPKSGKSGMFSKWLKEVGKTWADLFIRLAALFFAIYIIQAITINDGLNNLDSQYKFWVVLFLIIGALIFAKKLPKLIESILGIKLDSEFTLNPLKKIKDQALFGKTIAATPGKIAGFGAGLAGGAFAGGIAGSHVGATKRGMLLGAFSGAKNGFKKPKEAFTRGMREEYKNLSGNEMARLSLNKLMLQNEGKAKVQETKDALKIAYSNLNAKQTELNISENMTAKLAENLSTNGFDIKNIDGVLRDIMQKRVAQQQNLASMQANISNIRDAYKDAQGEYQIIENAIKSGMVNVHGNPLYSQQDLAIAKSKMEAAKSIYTEHQSKIQESKKMLAEYAQMQADIAKYQDNKKSEEQLRQIISEINKNIEAIKTEKAQREHFYQQDKTPQKDYKKAVDEETARYNGT